MQHILKLGIEYDEIIPQLEQMGSKIQNKLLKIDNKISARLFAGYFRTLYNLNVNRSEGRILERLIRD